LDSAVTDTFLVVHLDSGKHYWRVYGKDSSGYREASAIWSFTTIEPLAVLSPPNIPDKVSLAQNYPNPFNPTTVISYTIPKAMTVKLEVYNVLGNKVTVLVNCWVEAGTHQIVFNATELTSGMYFYRLQAGDKIVLTKKLLIVK
jgi:hypothetical protein